MERLELKILFSFFSNEREMVMLSRSDLSLRRVATQWRTEEEKVRTRENN